MSALPSSEDLEEFRPTPGRNPNGYDDERLGSHLNHALSLNLPRVKPQAAHKRRSVFCGGGPSLKDNLRKVRRQKADIVTSNHTHDFLIGRGIVPKYQVLLDPVEDMWRTFTPDRRVTYLVSATCHPNTFEHLEGHDVRLWIGEVVPGLRDRFPFNPEGNPVLIVPGGTTTALRWAMLGYGMGYRKVDYYGLDSSFRDEDLHTYDHPLKQDDNILELTVRGPEGDRVFRTTPGFARQANGFMQMIRQFDFGTAQGFDPMRIRAYGDGMIPYIYRQMEAT